MTESLRIDAVLRDTGIRRVLQLDGSMTLAVLHDVLQIAFGWEDRHLHEFGDDVATTADSLRWLTADALADGFDGLPETEWSVSSAFGATAGTLFYAYDLGDGWTHELTQLGSRPMLDGEPLARIVEGERRGPLENSGGPGGYAQVLAAWRDHAHPAHAEIAQVVHEQLAPWRRFDPDHFDLEVTNEELARLDPALASLPLLEEFTAALPIGSARVFRSYLAPLRRHDTEPASEEMARYLHPYLWFLKRIAGKGVPVTEAGWLQPGFVREVMDELGWAVRFPGQVRSEKSTPPVRRLKDHLRALGLVRKYRGRLMQQVKTALIAEEPRALWRYIAITFPQLARTPAERDAALLWAVEVALGSDPAERDERVAGGLAELGWQVREGEWPTAEDAAELSESVRRAFADLGDPVAAWPLREATPIARAFARAIVESAA